MREREIRSYSRISGVQTSRTNKVRTTGLAILVLGFVIGICGLATTATQQTDRLVAATAKQRAADTTSVPVKVPSTTPASMLLPLPVPASTPTATESASGEHDPATCNLSQRTAAHATRSQQLRNESRRHHNAMWSLQTTGMVARFFNPYMYNRRLNQERNTHQTALQQIQHRYTAALARAHC